MAVHRETPTCSLCGEPVAKAIYRDMGNNFIGDTFVRWEYLNHDCTPAKPCSEQEGDKVNIYEEIYENIMDDLKKYCVAGAYVEIRKDDNGYFFDCNLKDAIFILSGLFPEESVVEAFEDFDFSGVDKEGCWEIKCLLSYSPAQRGDEGRIEVQDYLMIEHKELIFQCSFEEREAQLKDFTDTDIFGNKLELPAASLPQPPVDNEDEIYEIDDIDTIREMYLKARKSSSDWAKKAMEGANQRRELQMEIEKLQSYPRWVELKEGNPLPDYDEPALWLSEDGNVHVESLDKDGNPWIFEGYRIFPDGPLIKTTHWHPLPKLPGEKKSTKEERMFTQKEAVDIYISGMMNGSYMESSLPYLDQKEYFKQKFNIDI